jgi:hypothetical protein
MTVQLRQIETHQLAEIKPLAAALAINALPLEVARDKTLLMSQPVDKKTTSDSAEDSHK